MVHPKTCPSFRAEFGCFGPNVVSVDRGLQKLEPCLWVVKSGRSLKTRPFLTLVSTRNLFILAQTAYTYVGVRKNWEHSGLAPLWWSVDDLLETRLSSMWLPFQTSYKHASPPRGYHSKPLTNTPILNVVTITNLLETRVSSTWLSFKTS